MKSALPKVMHPLANLPLLGHVLNAVRAAGAERLAVVAGPGMASVEAFVRNHAPGAMLFTQQERLGTAHAVLAAGAALQQPADDVLVLYGDTPLIAPKTLAALRAPLAAGAQMAVLGFRAADPAGYGRLLTEADGSLKAIREEKDASEDERRVDLCNSGVMAFAGTGLLELLQRIGTDNAKGEYYLTDAAELARADGGRVEVIVGDEDEVLGINTRAQLAEAERLLQGRLRAAAMAGGATLTAPETVFLSADTRIGRDVTVEPNVVIGPGVAIEDGATIRAFSHLEGASVGAGAIIGPYARLRPGAEIGEGGRIGNFVEIKKARIGAGSKVNHLAYVGDAEVGTGVNIGAGTITCNYDGFNKHLTVIGDGVFVGTNSSLVAPVKIGAGAYIGSGSVVAKDVTADALALERSEQVEKPGWAKRFRDRHGGKGST